MKKVIIAITIALSLSGCSATSALSGLVGSKPEITAQAGAENVKQTVGLTAKQDTSSKQESSFKDSNVGAVDTSSKKKVSTSTIQANEIKADTLQVVQGGDSMKDLMAPIVMVLFYAAGLLTARAFYKNKKEA